MRNIVIATHGDLAKGLVHALTMIAGTQAESIQVYGLYPGASAETFAEEIAQTLCQNKDDEVIVLTDLYGASVSNAMLHLATHERVQVITGVNLGLALAVLLDSSATLEEIDLQALVTEAQQGIQILQLDKSCENDDF